MTHSETSSTPSNWYMSFGIYFDDITTPKVYVGGGGGDISSQKFEYFDINKNEWFLLSDTNGSHSISPIIWTKNINIINIK